MRWVRLDDVNHLGAGRLHADRVGHDVRDRVSPCGGIGLLGRDQPFIDHLENRARSYIFTTAPTPADVAAARAALAVLRSAEGDALRATLAGHVNALAPGHPSPIIPIVLGSDERATRASALLRDRGVWVPAIRPPTAAPGTARLRVTVSAAHSDGHIALLLDALAAVAPGVSPTRS